MDQDALNILTQSDHIVEDFESSLKREKPYRHAGHAMIFARQENLFRLHCNSQEFPLKAAVLMQMRFDGTLGFPGGIIDPGESVLEGVNRELQEELGLDLSKHSCTMDDYVVTHYSETSQWVLHFFMKEVTLEEFKDIELKCLQCGDYGAEVLGLIRVPLFTMDTRGRGLPFFLNNNFIGNSRQQLLTALMRSKVLTGQDVVDAMKLRQAAAS